MLSTDQVHVAPLKRAPEEEEVGGDSKRLKREPSTRVNETILINPQLEETVEVDTERRQQLSSSANLIRTFSTDRFTLTSPDVFSSTKCGQVPHVTADLCPTELVGDVQVISLHSVLTVPGTAVLQTLNKTLADYMNSKARVILSPFDNLHPHDLTTYNDQVTVSVWNKSGRKKLSVREYCTFVEVSQPEMWISMSDIVPATVSFKRANKSCYRTLNWANESINFLSENQSVKSKVLVALPGSGHRQLMLKSAKILANRDVFGYVVERSTLPATGWEALVKDIVSILPAHKPVLFLGALNSYEMMLGYSCGCHFVDNSYCLAYSNAGHALAFDIAEPSPASAVPPSPTNNTTAAPSNTATSDFGPSLTLAISQPVEESNSAPKKNKKPKETGKIPLYSFTDYISNPDTTLDLNNTCFNSQFVPLLANCTCFTCARHTRAYLNHLIVTKELLAPTLLMLHNLHHTRTLCNAVRDCLRSSGGVAELVTRVANVFAKS